MTHRFSPQLLLKRIGPSPRHYGSTAQNHRATSRRLHPLAQAKTGAAVNPVPPFWLLPSLAQFLGSAPLLVIAFPNIPRIQFYDQRKGLHWLLAAQLQ